MPALVHLFICPSSKYLSSKHYFFLRFYRERVREREKSQTREAQGKQQAEGKEEIGDADLIPGLIPGLGIMT